MMIRSVLYRNLLANYLSVLWIGGLGIVMVPIYFSMLGPSQWGLVAICMTLQGFMNLLDLGLQQIMPRDMAVVANDDLSQARVYRIFSSAYAYFGGAALAVGIISVPVLDKFWVNRHSTDLDSSTWSLVLVMMQFFFQFSNNANIGYWNGLQKQVIVNLRMSIFAALKHAAAVFAIYFYDANATSYIGATTFVCCLEYWLNRKNILQGLADRVRPYRVTFTDLKSLYLSLAGFTLSILVGMLVSQADRLILSYKLSPDVFGGYVVVATLGLAMLQLQYPLMKAIFPIVVQEQKNDFRNKIFKKLKWVLLLCVAPCVFVAFFSENILQIWLGKTHVPQQGPQLLTLIVVAVSLNGVFHLIYQYMLKTGASRELIKINFVSLFAVLSVLFLSVQSQGVLAGGVAWIVNASIQLIMGIIWIRYKMSSTKFEGQ